MADYPRGYLISSLVPPESAPFAVCSSEFYIGSGIHCNIRLSADEVKNEQHCLIKVHCYNNVTIHSLDTERPVYVNNRKVEGDDCWLNNGDVIRIENHTFTWKKADFSTKGLDTLNMSLTTDSKPAPHINARHSAPAQFEEDCLNEKAECAMNKTETEEQQQLQTFQNTDSDVLMIPDFVVLNNESEQVKIPESAHSASRLQTPESSLNSTCSTLAAGTPVLAQSTINMSVPNMSQEDITESFSEFRSRRSTGTVPFVGTPSDVYRTSRMSRIETPNWKPRAGWGTKREKKTVVSLSTSVGQEQASSHKSDSLHATSSVSATLPSSASGRVRQHSSERKSTPLKPRVLDKSMNRESYTCPPIIENTELEEISQVQNDSSNPEARFKFVASRRHQRVTRPRRYTIEDKIVEENETSKTDQSQEYNEDVTERDESLLDMNSYCDNSELPMTARIIVNCDNACEEGDLNSTFTTENQLDGTFNIETDDNETEHVLLKNVKPKSILTPLPKAGVPHIEKSAKKVTFAQSVINETFEKDSICDESKDSIVDNKVSFTAGNSSEPDSILSNKTGIGMDVNNYSSSLDSLLSQQELNDNSLTKNSTETSAGFRSYMSHENTELESFCRNEELFKEEISMSELAISSCSTPKKQSIRNLVSNSVSETTKTPANSPMNEDFSYSVRESNFPSNEEDVDLTRAEKYKFLNSSAVTSPKKVSTVSHHTSLSSVASMSHCSSALSTSPCSNISSKKKSAQAGNILVSTDDGNAADIAKSINCENVCEDFSCVAEPLVVNHCKESSMPPEIIVTEFVDSNDNTVMTENIQAVNVTEDMLGPLPESLKDINRAVEKTVKGSEEASLDRLSILHNKSATAQELIPKTLASEHSVSQPKDDSIIISAPTVRGSTTKTETDAVHDNTISDSSMCIPKTPPDCQSITTAVETTVTDGDIIFAKNSAIDITQSSISMVTPCTSTPCHNNNKAHQSDDINTIPNLSSVQYQTASSEMNSKASQHVPDVAVLESNATEIKSIDFQATVQLKNVGQTPVANYENVAGMKELFKTPLESKISYENVRGMKEMFKTPDENEISYGNVRGMKELFKTPADPDAKCSYENVEGVKRLLRTPIDSKSSYESVTGMKKLLKTPFVPNYEENCDGIKNLMKTPSSPIVRSVEPVTPIGSIMDGVQELPETPLSDNITCKEPVQQTLEVGHEIDIMHQKPETNFLPNVLMDPEILVDPSCKSVNKPDCTTPSKERIAISESQIITPRKTPRKSLMTEIVENIRSRSCSRRCTLAQCNFDNQENENQSFISSSQITPRKKCSVTPMKTSKSSDILQTIIHKVTNINELKDEKSFISNEAIGNSICKVVSEVGDFVYLKNIENVLPSSPLREKQTSTLSGETMEPIDKTAIKKLPKFKDAATSPFLIPSSAPEIRSQPDCKTNLGSDNLQPILANVHIPDVPLPINTNITDSVKKVKKPTRRGQRVKLQKLKMAEEVSQAAESSPKRVTRKAQKSIIVAETEPQIPVVTKKHSPRKSPVATVISKVTDGSPKRSLRARSKPAKETAESAVHATRSARKRDPIPQPDTTSNHTEITAPGNIKPNRNAKNKAPDQKHTPATSAVFFSSTQQHLSPQPKRKMSTRGRSVVRINSKQTGSHDSNPARLARSTRRSRKQDVGESSTPTTNDAEPAKVNRPSRKRGKSSCAAPAEPQVGQNAANPTETGSETSAKGRKRRMGGKSCNITFSRVSLTVEIEKERFPKNSKSDDEEERQVPSKKPKIIEATMTRTRKVVTRKSSAQQISKDESKIVSKRSSRKVTETTTSSTSVSAAKRPTRVVLEEKEHECEAEAKAASKTSTKSGRSKRSTMAATNAKKVKTENKVSSPPQPRVTRSRSKLR